MESYDRVRDRVRENEKKGKVLELTFSRHVFLGGLSALLTL